MGRNIIGFELRKKRDDDLKDAIEQIPKQDRSEAIRAILRGYFYPADTNTLPDPVKRRTPAAAGLEIGSITLDRQEKSAEELDGALDSLLNDF